MEFFTDLMLTEENEIGLNRLATSISKMWILLSFYII